MGTSRLLGKVKKTATRAMGKVLASEKGSAAVAEAFRRVQQGRELYDTKATELASALGLATKADVENISRKVAKLRKQVQAMLDELEAK